MGESDGLAKKDTYLNIISRRILGMAKQMRKDGVKEETLLEVTLFSDVEYDNGETCGNWGEYEGTRKFKKPYHIPHRELSTKPGLKILGPVTGIYDKGIQLNVIGNLFIEYIIIRSYKILTYKNPQTEKDANDSSLF